MMKQLRQGYTTGSCAAAASLGSVIWQTTGIMPDQVSLETPSGIILHLEIQNCGQHICGVIKDAGDDPDCTDGCLVISHVQIFPYDGDISFHAGEGIGIVTKRGLKLPVGEPAVNPVPRQMIIKAIRSVIGSKSASVTLSIPNGKTLAEHTFNPRLGIEGGLSILGTTGIVRPMSEEAVKDSLRLELSMYREEYGQTCAFVTGYAGENYLKQQYPKHGTIMLCSNYLGYLLDCAEEMHFTDLLLAGRTGKLCKPAADIMYLHSHTAGGQREIICTHAALAGADTVLIQELYQCRTTIHMQEILKDAGFQRIWQTIAEAGVRNCERRTHGNIRIGMILIDESDQMLAKTDQTEQILKAWCHS